jgi:ABC-type sugar transport system, periplasmic component
MKKITLLAVVLILIVLSACSDNTADSGSNVDTTAAVTDIGEETSAENVETQRSQIKDTLPESLDFDGTVIRVLSRDDGTSLGMEIIAPEETGDVVIDAIYNRQIKVEERLNVKIEPIYVNQDIHGGDQINSRIRKAVLAGSDDYDIAANHMSQYTPLILEGAFLNLNKLDYLDFDQPWWSASFKEKISVDGKLYFAVGDIALTMIKAMYTQFINLDLFENVFPNEDIYEIVLSGNWTIDKMIDYCKSMYNDLNGDGAIDINDQFGYMVNSGGHHADAWMGATNVPIIDSSGATPEFILDNPITYEFVDSYRRLLFNDNCSFLTTLSDSEYYKPFKEGRALFTAMMLSNVEHLRDMDPDYGMIPIAKLNETQEEYTGWTHNGFSAFAVIQTCQYPDTAAALLEAMCVESYRNVTEAFFDVALKLKYARDDTSSRMLDIVRESIVFDFGMVYSQALESVMQMFRDATKPAEFNTASKIATKLSVSQKKLDDLLLKYSELE